MRYRNIARAAVLSLGLMLALFTLPALAQSAGQGTTSPGSAATHSSRHERGAKASNPNATDQTAPGGAATDANAPNASSQNPSNPSASSSSAVGTASTTPSDQSNPNTAATQPAGTTNTGNTGGGSSGGWGLWGLVGLFGLFGLGGGRRERAVDETRQDVRRIA